MNKRGQTEVSLGTLLLLILGIGGLILVGFGFYKYWDKITQPSEQAPEALVAVKSCEFSVSIDDKGGYCADFKEVEVAGKKQFVNCDYLIQLGNTIQGSEKISCDATSDYAKMYCESLKTSQGTNYDGTDLVNGQTCLARGIELPASA